MGRWSISGDEIVLDRARAHDLDVVIDRVVLKEGLKGRVTDSVELALKLGEGRLLVDPGEGGEPIWMSERFACIDCGISLPPIEPRMFSFNGPHGACPACDGIGARTKIDPARVVPDRERTLREGAVLAWGRRGSPALAAEMARAVQVLGVSPDVPWSSLPEAAKQAILFGQAGHARGKKAGAAYDGIVAATRAPPVPRQRGGRRRDPTMTTPISTKGAIGDDDLGRFAVTRTCDACGGRRLRPEALAVRLGEKNIAEIGALALRHVRTFLEDLLSPASALNRRASGPSPNRCCAR